MLDDRDETEAMLDIFELEVGELVAEALAVVIDSLGGGDFAELTEDSH